MYVKVIGSEEPRRLTSDPAEDGSPAWSPDGRQIAFLRQRPGGSAEVRLVPPTGGSERVLTEVQAEAARSGLSWTPDNRQLAVVDRSTRQEPSGIWLLDLETPEKTQLTFPPSVPFGDSVPVFSPDGRELVFNRQVSPNSSRLLKVQVSAGEIKELSSYGAAPREIAWTAETKEVIFPAPGNISSEASSAFWRIPAIGGEAARLSGTEHARDVAISREGDRLVYSQRLTQLDNWRLELIEGSNSRSRERFIPSTRAEAYPDVSSDGKRIAFVSARTGKMQLWVAEEDGSSLLQLTSFGEQGSPCCPRWSPDGKEVTFSLSYVTGEPNDIFVVSSEGGPPRQITTAAASDVVPSWSRDGQWIYFASDRSGEW